MPEITLHDAPDANGNAVAYAFHLPAGWDDAQLTGAHLISISKALCLSAVLQNELAKDNEEDTPVEPQAETARSLAKRDLFMDLLDLPEALRARLPQDIESWMYEHDTTDRHTGFAPVEASEYQVLPQLNWCWTPPKFSRSLLPTLQHGGTEWVGPDDDFTSMLLDQWLWCTQLLRAFREAAPEHSETALNNLLGALYLPKHERTWRHQTIDARGLRLADLPLPTKLACVLNFEAIHATLPDTYWRVFDPSGSAAQSPAGVFGMAYDVARSGVFGKESEVVRALLHTVLAYMEHSLFLDEENEKRAKAAAKNNP